MAEVAPGQILRGGGVVDHVRFDQHGIGVVEGNHDGDAGDEQPLRLLVEGHARLLIGLLVGLSH
jgi:hypothetical protein